MTSLDGVPVPYDGWIDQLNAAGCTPSVAQALRPYPQYCSQLNGLNENAGNSTYHSFQLKAERRFAQGVYLLAAYTWSKTIASSDTTQQTVANWNGAWGSISPYERQRNKGLSTDDVPHILSLTFVYDLPFGQGKRFMNRGGIVDKLLGGWTTSGIFRVTSGIPFFFRSGTCPVGDYLDAQCIPGIIPGANPWAQDKGSYDPNKGPLFNVDAFEPVSAFEVDPNRPLYIGSGARITNLRGFGYKDQSFALIKDIKITERVNFQLRGEFFNIWNWHTFARDSREEGALAFNTDISSTDFGQWGGNVTNPRNIQVAARLTF